MLEEVFVVPKRFERYAYEEFFRRLEMLQEVTSSLFESIWDPMESGSCNAGEDEPDDEDIDWGEVLYDTEELGEDEPDDVDLDEIKDTDAIKLKDWHDEMDGEWKPPVINNPRYGL